jgi:lipooligosaccharide transport system permease protein
MSTTKRRLHRLEWAAILGVMVREAVNFKSFWRSSTFSSIINPTVYLLAFGFGFGSLVASVAGYRYLDFIGTGMVATTVIFAGTFPAMFSTFVKHSFQHTYDSILAAPVDTEELVTAEILCMGVRVGIFGTAPILVAVAFGLAPSWGMLLVPLIAGVAGLGWAAFGIFISGISKSMESFSYWMGALLTPVFLVAGTFFPLSGLPGWAQTLGGLNPLYHCVELVRSAVFGFQGWNDVGHLAVLIVFALISWRLAIRYMERKLIL